MTREEAIKGLEWLRSEFSGYKPNEEMFTMAIEALAAEPIYCNECRHQDYCYQVVSYTKVRPGYSEHSAKPIEWCSRAERKEE